MIPAPGIDMAPGTRSPTNPGNVVGPSSSRLNSPQYVAANRVRLQLLPNGGEPTAAENHFASGLFPAPRGCDRLVSLRRT